MERKNIVIVGAGIAGSFLAILISKKGYKVTLLEKLSKSEIIDAASKRSYNLTLYGFGLNLLKNAGLWKVLEHEVIPLKGSVTTLPHQAKSIVSINSNKAPYYAISRSKLLELLLERAALEKNVNVRFSSKLSSYNVSTNTVTYKDKAGLKSIKTELLIGCDGVNSKVRELILKKTNGSLSKEYSNWVYQQVPLSQEKCKLLGMKPNFAYTWSSKNAVIASFPNKNQSSTALLIYPQGKRPSFRSLKKWFPSLFLAEEEFEESKVSPEGRFVTIHSSNWFYKEKMVILGDAAHGFNPFFGQGISAAFGDSIELCNSKSLEAFENKRKINMDTLGELSKEGFERYKRSKRADFDVIYDRVEGLLHSLFPTKFSPSIFESISIDPGQAKLYLQKRISQRRILEFFGLKLAISIVILVLDLGERISRVKPQAALPQLGKTVLKVS